MDGQSLIYRCSVDSHVGKLGEGLVIVAAMIGLGLALMYLFLVWMPSFKFSV